MILFFCVLELIHLSKRNAEGTYEEVLPNEISSIEGGTESRTQASSTPRQRPDVESLLAKSRLNTTVHLSRAEISANFGMYNIIKLQRKLAKQKQMIIPRNIRTVAAYRP